MADPLTDIENAKAQMDMGTMGFRVWKGAVEDGATFDEADRIVQAWYFGLFAANKLDDSKNTDSE